MADLIPCPWCPSTDWVVSSFGMDSYNVVCTDCGAEGPTGATEAEAIAAWNTRPEMEEMRRVLEPFARYVAARVEIFGTESSLSWLESSVSNGKVAASVIRSDWEAAAALYRKLGGGR